MQDVAPARHPQIHFSQDGPLAECLALVEGGCSARLILARHSSNGLVYWKIESVESAAKREGRA